MATEQHIKIDFHTHILPKMDDGAKDVETAFAMLHTLQQQGVETVALTPHYYADNETPTEFLLRREHAFSALKEAGEIPLNIVMGAEVHITRELTQTPDIEKLRLGNSEYILLELPYLPLADWVIEVIEHIYYRYNCKPLLAHLPRYVAYYEEKDFDALFALQDVVVQVNAEDLQHKYTRKLVKKWIKDGVAIVFGSDCHSMGRRRPSFDTVVSHTSKLRRGTCPAYEANDLAQEMHIV